MSIFFWIARQSKQTCNKGIKNRSAVTSGRTTVTSPPPASSCSRSSSPKLDGNTAKCLSCRKYRSRKNLRHLASLICFATVTYRTSGFSSWSHAPQVNISDKTSVIFELIVGYPQSSIFKLLHWRTRFRCMYAHASRVLRPVSSYRNGVLMTIRMRFLLFYFLKSFETVL